MSQLFENIDLIIINYNGKNITSDCIDSAVFHNFPLENIIVVDNDSDDGSVWYLSNNYPKLKLIENPSNMGYAAAVNKGMQASNKKYAIISNNDILFKHSAFESLINTFNLDDKIAAVGPQQEFPDGSWQRSSGLLPMPSNYLKELFFYGFFSDLLLKIRFKLNCNTVYYPQYLDGGLIAVKNNIFNEVNGFDENFFFYTEEADFCYRISKSGYKIAINTSSKVIHLRGASSYDLKINNKAIKMLVDSKFKFLIKYFDKSAIKKYIKSVIINHITYISIWKMLRLLPSEKIKSISDNKIRYFLQSKNEWIIIMNDL